MLSTGTRALDELLGGGFAPGILTQVYGPYASGKTTLAIQAGILSGGKVAYVDTEGGFSPERLSQMAGLRGFDPEEALSRFVLFHPGDFKEQRRIIGSLKKIVNGSFSLVVVDSITAHYRAEEDWRSLNVELNKQLQVLLWIARKNSIPVLVINQVHFDSETGMTKPVAEQTLGYRCKDILRLDRLPTPGRRVAVLERHRFRPEGLMAYFRITEKGIEDSVELGRESRKEVPKTSPESIL
ncbi:DNA repair and recombination protein RadB [Thermococcus zilligii]|uniref:DNA repair and recombination protein RadB n=1 Tax=Thermococcus zilligii TaxID=54076 RepID=UPI00029B4A6C|nr:DNA repair and recombination protein RadB [Thermococcus zilligii]